MVQKSRDSQNQRFRVKPEFLTSHKTTTERKKKLFALILKAHKRGKTPRERTHIYSVCRFVPIVEKRRKTHTGERVRERRFCFVARFVLLRANIVVKEEEEEDDCEI